MSKIHPKFKAVNKDGIIYPLEENSYRDYLATLPEAVEIVVRPYQKYTSRSNQQNRYYMGVLLQVLSDEIGHNKDELHEILKFKFLRRWVLIKDQEHEIIDSTTNLSTTEFEDYLRQIREWASSELGIFLPKPQETSYD